MHQQFYTFDEVRTALEPWGLRPSGKGFKFRCPLHDDENPSATLSRGDRSEWVVYCHVCGRERQDDLVRDVLEQCERVHGPRGDGRRVARRTRYEHRDRDGNLVAIHERIDYEPIEHGRRNRKRFRWLKPDGTSGGVKPNEVPLYGTEILASADPADPVIVAEGQKAADALRGLRQIALAVPGSNVNPADHVLKPLTGRKVVLWPDADEPGMKLMRRLARRLDGIAADVRVVRPPDGVKKGWDAADAVAALGPERTLDLIGEAVPWREVWSDDPADADGVKANGGVTGERTTDDDARQGKTSVDVLMDLADETFRSLFCDQFGNPWAVTGDGRLLEFDDAVAQKLDVAYLKREGKPALLEALRRVVRIQRHIALDGERRRVEVRSAFARGALYVWVNRNRVAKIDADGWRFEGPPDDLFFSESTWTEPLPDPVSGGDAHLDDLLDLLAGDNPFHRRIIETWMTLALFSQIARPILLFTGPPGVGKSLRQRIIKTVLDPGRPWTLSLRRDRFDDTVRQARKCQILVFDNLGRITTEQADWLCRAVTGEAIARRELYQTDRDRIFEYRRAIMLNAVVSPSGQGDLLDRSVVVELDRPTHLATEQEILTRLESRRGAWLGAIFKNISAVLEAEPRVRVNSPPRLADYARLAAALYTQKGWGAEAYRDDWRRIGHAQASAVGDRNPLIEAVVELVDARGGYLRATPAEIFAMLQEHGVRSLPDDEQRLGVRLKYAIPQLEAEGLVVSRPRTSNKRFWEIRRVEEPNGPTIQVVSLHAGDHRRDGHDGCAELPVIAKSAENREICGSVTGVTAMTATFSKKEGRERKEERKYAQAPAREGVTTESANYPSYPSHPSQNAEFAGLEGNSECQGCESTRHVPVTQGDASDVELF